MNQAASFENDAKRTGAQFQRANYMTIDGASHDFWFLHPPPWVPEITNAFLRGDPMRDEQVTWPVVFRRLE